MAMNLERTRRLLKLLGLLQAGRDHNAESLAQACGVSRRTIFRDLDILRQSGVPLLYDEEEQRYHIPGTYFLPPTNFTPEEALTLLALANELGDASRIPFFGPARSAALKLESSLPSRLREQLKPSSSAIRIRPTASNPMPGQEPIFDTLLSAHAKRTSVRIHYRSPIDPNEMVTKLQPYHLLFSRRSWYVIGRSSLHRATRTFNVGRIGELETLDDSYDIPRGFSVDRYLRNAWHLIPEPGPDREVVVRFSPLVAQNVSEVRWHKTQRTQHNPDGTLDFRVTVSGISEISWWILGYGNQAEVLEPRELRERIIDHAHGMLRVYREE